MGVGWCWWVFLDEGLWSRRCCGVGEGSGEIEVGGLRGVDGYRCCWADHVKMGFVEWKSEDADWRYRETFWFALFLIRKR